MSVLSCALHWTIHTHIGLCKNVKFWCSASSSTNKYQHTISCAQCTTRDTCCLKSLKGFCVDGLLPQCRGNHCLFIRCKSLTCTHDYWLIYQSEAGAGMLSAVPQWRPGGCWAARAIKWFGKISRTLVWGPAASWPPWTHHAEGNWNFANYYC